MTRFKTFTQNAKTKISRISWGAILAGALTALAIAFILNLLGLGIGLTTIDPLTENHTFDGLGTGTIIWWVVSNLVALFAGGLVAGRSAGLPSKSDGGIHGFLAWGIYLFLALFVMTSVAGAALSGMGSMVSSVFGSDDAKQVVVDLKNAQKESEKGTMSSFKNVKQEIYQVIQTAEDYGVAPDDAKQNVKGSMDSVQSKTSKAIKKLDLKDAVSEFINDVSVDLDKQGNLNISVEGDGDYLNKKKLKNYLTKNTELSDAEINGVINKWDKKLKEAVKKAEALYQKAKKKALKASEKISDAVGTASIYLFIALLLGSLAAFFGGTAGSPVLTVDEEHEEDLDDDYREDREESRRENSEEGRREDHKERREGNREEKRREDREERREENREEKRRENRKDRRKDDRDDNNDHNDTRPSDKL